MIYLNTKMKEFMILNDTNNISELYEKLNMDSEKVEKSFNLNFDFVEISGCILLKDNITENIHEFKVDTIKRLYYDQTGFETSVNEIYVNQYYYLFENAEYSINEIFNFSISIVCILWHKLKKHYPERSFQIVLSIDEIDNDMEGEDSATIRFYTLRDNDIPYINIEKIDKSIQPLLVYAW